MPGLLRLSERSGKEYFKDKKAILFSDFSTVLMVWCNGRFSVELLSKIRYSYQATILLKLNDEVQELL